MAKVAGEERNQGNVESVPVSPEMAAALGETGLAHVIPFPESSHEPAVADEIRPGMANTLAAVNWHRQSIARDSKWGFAEFKRDEGGLYVDHQGSKVYLND